MARKIPKIKEPLILNGVEVRDIENLRENFNVAVLADYAFDGRLIKWLRERYYEDEAEKVAALKQNDSNLEDKLYEIFKVEKPEDPEIIAWRRERLERLKNFTNDKNILAKVDNVAFNQEELGDLLDEGFDEIYLCSNKFTIPLKVKNKKYIGVGDAVAVISSETPVNFDVLNISFENVRFDDVYGKITMQFKINNRPSKTKKTEIFVRNNTVSASTTISNKAGVHARPASVFVQTASKFKSKVQIAAKGKKVDAKSILMVMSMGLSYGTAVTISAEGADAEEAVKTLIELIDSRFGE